MSGCFRSISRLCDRWDSVKLPKFVLGYIPKHISRDGTDRPFHWLNVGKNKSSDTFHLPRIEVEVIGGSPHYRLKVYDTDGIRMPDGKTMKMELSTLQNLAATLQVIIVTKEPQWKPLSQEVWTTLMKQGAVWTPD